MSDYFGALLRSSGLAGRPVAPPPALPEVDVDSTVVGAPGDPASADAANGARGAAPARFTPAAAAEAPGRTPSTAASAGVADGPAAAGPAAGSATGPAAVDKTSVSLAATPQVMPAAPAPPVPIDLPAPPEVASHPAVQAALRWVAADPLTRPQETEAPRRVPAAGVDRAPAQRLPLATTAPVAAPPQRSDPVGATPPAGTTARATAIERRRPLPVPDDEPAVEVSIGSIHLRVDASPAPQAPQMPPRSAAPAASAAPPAAARSGLARRALRRL